MSRNLGEVQQLAGPGYVPANYDPTGRGLAHTEAWGWALTNGQNGTTDTGDQFIVGASPSKGIGSTGGAASALVEARYLPRQSPWGVSDPGHNHVVPVNQAAAGNGQVIAKGDETTGTDYARRTRTETTGITLLQLPGVQEQLPTLPPYTALVMRQWIGYN